jgi:DNA-binding NarL/FixJ family response regulator
MVHNGLMTPPGPDHRPVRVALVDDYEIVLVGIAHMLAPYHERVEVVEIDVDEPVRGPVDVALYDTFAQGEADGSELGVLIANPRARRVAVYTWVLEPALVETALRRGAAGYLAKSLPAARLVDELERIAAGEIVVPDGAGRAPATARDWPGRGEGLTEREAEVLALITQGRSNAEIATSMYLSINSVKTHIRNAYRKIGVATRTQAVLWGVDHGFKVDMRVIDAWL